MSCDGPKVFDGAGQQVYPPVASGSGDVVGPASSTDSVPALFDGTTGKLLKNSTPTGSGNPVLATSPTIVTPTIASFANAAHNHQDAAGGAQLDARAVAFIGCKVYRTSAYSVSDVTTTPIPFDNEEIDTNGFHDNVTNNTRITIPTGLGGYYHVGIIGSWDASTTGIREMNIRVNGSTVIALSTTVGQSSYEAVATSVVKYLNAADYIELAFYQSSGGALNFRGTAYRSQMWAYLLGV